MTRAKAEMALPWFKRKRCETGDGDPQTMECMVCGAALGEVCRRPKEKLNNVEPKS